jgi:hypothetical protein
MFFVVSPPDTTDWTFDKDRLAALLARDWPGVIVSSADTVHPSLDTTWVIQIRGGELKGSQDRAGQAQYLEGPNDLIARYAAWWRWQVDPEQPLILYDESYTIVVPLTPGINGSEVLERLKT